MGNLAKVGFAGAGATDTGLVRDGNQDAFFVSEDQGVAVVSDGMGGAPAGDVASRLAVDQVVAALFSSKSQWDRDGWETIGAVLGDAIETAHAEIRRHGAERPDDEGLGATMTAFVADAEGKHYAIGHVGDSRAYLLRRGLLTQLTRDDTLLQEHVDEGRITQRAADRHPFGHILSQVLGMEHGIVPQIVEGTLELGDQLFLCSDGVTAVLNDREIGEMLVRGRLWPVGTVVKAFIESANERGGPDNATAVLLRRE